MIVPFSPGGTSDTLARILGQKMTEQWGQQVRGGFSSWRQRHHRHRDCDACRRGWLYADATATWRNGPSTPPLYNKLPYDMLRDFAPLSLVATAPQLLVVNPSLAARSVRELIDLAKASPGKLNFGSGGTGTLSFVGGELFRIMTGVNIVHVSYKGTVLALTDLMAGQVHMLFLRHAHRLCRKPKPANCAHWASPVRSVQHSPPACPRWRNRD